MITEETARDMMNKLSSLRMKAQKEASDDNEMQYKKYESECLNTFRYFVVMKTGRYRKFANYDDLNQEGMEALLKAMKTFKNNKGSFFFWAGLFVNTRIVRSANNHNVIRYPMHVAKLVKPHKESLFPVMLDSALSPEDSYESEQVKSKVGLAIKDLPEDQRDLVSMFYGFSEDKPLSITKICKRKKISRVNCLKILGVALDKLKEEIKI